ncbi:MAG: hypothetical protein KKD05_06955 [Candidatus Omnitrophica bacterium]|nr:hypothetical protein [Candidatus Omnitrophota bacterium]
MLSKIAKGLKCLNENQRSLFLLGVVFAVLLCSYGYAQTIEGTGVQKKQDLYYFKKILDNEIAFLKKKIKQQEVEHALALQNQRDLYDKLLNQQKSNETILSEPNQQQQIDQLKEQLIKVQKQSMEDEKQIQIQKQENDVLRKKQNDLDAQKNIIGQSQNEELLQIKKQFSDAQNQIKQLLQQNNELLNNQQNVLQDKTNRDESQRKEIAQLKETVSQLQKEKEQSSKELADLKKTNKGLADIQKQLGQEKIKTLDEYKAVIEDLKSQLKIFAQKSAEESKDHEQALIQKELENGVKLKTLFDQVNEAKNIKISEDKQVQALKDEVKLLNEKVKAEEKAQLELLGAKEKQYNEQLQKIAEGREKYSLNREQEIGNIKDSVSQRDSQILALKQQVKDLTQKYDKQQAVFDQILTRKDQDIKEQLEKIEKQKKEDSLKAEDAFGIKLTEKYKQLDSVMREKEQMQIKILSDKDEEIKAVKAQALEREKTLRQFAATKELEFSRENEKLKNEYQQQIDSLKKSSEQLKIYQIKLKEESKTQELIINEKDNRIANLNKRLSLYSGEEAASQQKITQVLKDDLNNTQLEDQLNAQRNKYEDLLLKEKKLVEALNKNLLDQKAIFENRLAKQKKSMVELESKFELKLMKNSEEWEKKIKLLESKYITAFHEVENSKLNAESEYKKRLEEVTVKLKDKVMEEGELKTKMDNFRQNQVELLEGMLTSKATMMQNLTLDFKGPEKERAQTYFQRAMTAILKKNYARAKYELEQVLTIEPEDQITVDILGSLEFLLERAQ